MQDINYCTNLYYEVHQFVSPHLFKIGVSDQEADVIALQIEILIKSAYVNASHVTQTSTAFRRIITKCSARCIKKLVNLRHNISSISSACLILIDTRTELMEGSIKHLSVSVLLTTSGLSSNSLLLLEIKLKKTF
jgi:hypothetical protein